MSDPVQGREGLVPRTGAAVTRIAAMAWESLAATAFQLRAARGTLNCATQRRLHVPFLNK